MRPLTGFLHFVSSNSWKLKYLSFAGDAEDWCNAMQCKTICSALLGKVCAYLNMHKRREQQFSIWLFYFNLRDCWDNFWIASKVFKLHKKLCTAIPLGGFHWLVHVYILKAFMLHCMVAMCQNYIFHVTLQIHPFKFHTWFNAFCITRFATN